MCTHKWSKWVEMISTWGSHQGWFRSCKLCSKKEYKYNV